MVTTRATLNGSASPTLASETSQVSNALELAITIVQENLDSRKYFKVCDRKRLLELLELLHAECHPPFTSLGTQEPEAISTDVHISLEASREDPPLTLPYIPSWSIERLRNQAAAHRYETSLYGPVATILLSLFPAARNFMIKPQGLFRKADKTSEVEVEGILTELDPESAEYICGSQPGDADPNTTMDSYAGESFLIEFIPDYLVCKACASIHSDKLLTIIEIKRKDCNRAAALIIGDEVFVYEVDTSKDILDDEELPCRTYPISSPQFLHDLRSIAVEHWNEPVVRVAPPKPSNLEDKKDENPLYN